MVSDAGQYIQRYKNNYELWMKEVLGATITSDQRELAVGLRDEHFVSGKSGTTTGKTTYAATAALHFFTTRPEAKVVCTAPTGHQLEDLLFAEMESWIRRIKVPFIRDGIKMIKNKIYIEGYRDWFIVARTIPKDSRDKLGDVLAGFHAPSLLFIVDEASRVPDAVFAGIEGSMIQDNVYCLLVGNPTQASGFFFDTHNKNRDHWCNVTLSSIDSPFTNAEWIDRMRIMYGEDTDWFRTKILGQFPLGHGQIVATYEQLRESFTRHKLFDIATLKDIIKVAGLDPAGGKNDSSILTDRQGAYVHPPIRVRHHDTNELVDFVTKHCQGNNIAELYVEYNGIGVAIYDQLKIKPGFKTYKVITNARANNPQAYRNIRAELAKELSDNFDLLAISDHDRYVQEIPEVAFIPDSEPLQVIDKKKLKDRLGFSPDFFDSLMISTYRHFDLGRVDFGHSNLAGFEAANTMLTQETSFVKL